jgi:NAD(P)-dependent dehydrogenase (short-subunit alcohol dehydrogenase family)
VSAAPRNAIVTGASSGIGAATALELARQGFRVAIGARRVERLREVAGQIETAGGRALAHFLDVSQPDSIDAFYSAAEAALGPIDLLVNNAGMSILNLLPDAKVEDLRAELEVNLLGPMLFCRRAIPGMLERRRGDLVFVGSENAVRPRPFTSAYTAAKAGLEGLARVLAMELDGTGVRSIVVRVGPTGSEFGSRMDHAKLKQALEAWRYWGVQRHLHFMPSESVAKAIARVVATPVEESYPNLIEVMPGGRKRSAQRAEGERSS